MPRTIGGKETDQTPTYLRGYEELYRLDPRQAALKWFEDARYGLFIHYGIYSRFGRGEWLQYNEKIRVSEYERFKDDFTADRFNAERIADMAVQGGMRYINITTRHHDSFCLFETRQTEFNSLNSPAGRDLVGELAEACRRRGLGLFLYYSYGADWRHPYFHSRDAGSICARPDYDPPEPSYLFRRDEDFAHYIDFVHRQIAELLTQYGPIAGIWFDLITACYYRPDLFPVSETYRRIRELQPQCLISFKQGFTGTEDFMSQEIVFEPLKERLIAGGASKEAVDLSERVWRMNIGKWNEVCTIMQDRGWSYVSDAAHKSEKDVLDLLAYTSGRRCNLLMNTGPLPDGSIHPADEAAFSRAGEWIANNGYPAPGHGDVTVRAVATGTGAV